ncbi:DgyrCDS9500 [Dimorphilus gyrociliatus]|uniref:DgyrCDS9500 n=1 Tax=Dimorphilus gyrociliatus TaxID=2664684 RepID=A0A7I8VX63_9ANNE|nr:DgyrCDS9500 [Dimorphilus gyrociliatus]
MMNPNSYQKVSEKPDNDSGSTDSDISLEDMYSLTDNGNVNNSSKGQGKKNRASPFPTLSGGPSYQDIFNIDILQSQIEHLRLKFILTRNKLRAEVKFLSNLEEHIDSLQKEMGKK